MVRPWTSRMRTSAREGASRTLPGSESVMWATPREGFGERLALTGFPGIKTA